ncbi:MAG: hypothetical protein GOVbin3661_75 [Prokaryotic dsDNA virus sp.]|nr:MAG: hypothetical protein GOVbin3661_75 [Prokaryotic dsDNA virus sp.]|tara:strand:+ start:3254 stop:4540 length:1287 start_codon:yes stop_codon:yes gene_type:complete
MADFNKSKNNFFGTYIINDSNKATINCTSIIVRADATFTSLKVAGQQVDVRARYLQDKGGAIPTGTELVCKDGYFSEITLEKGIVEIVLMQRDPKPIAVPELPDPNAGFRITSCPGVVPGGEYTVLTSGFAEEVGITLAAGMSLTFSGVEPFPNGCYYVTETDLGGEVLEVEGGEVAVVEDGPCLDCVENSDSFVLFPCEGEEGEIFYADSAVGVDLNTYVGASLRIGETCYRVEKSLVGGPALEAPFGDPCGCGEEPPAPECPGELDECENCSSDEGYLPPDECGNCPGAPGYPCEPGGEFTLLIEGVEGSQNGNPDLPPPFGAGPEGSEWVLIQVSEDVPGGLAWDLVCGQPEFGLPLSEPIGDTPWMIHNEVGSAYLPKFAFNGIGDLQPGAVYQISITQNRTLNPAAIEGLEGLISFYTPEELA